MKKGYRFLVLTMVILALFLSVSYVRAEGAEVFTDKADYAPDEPVIIMLNGNRGMIWSFAHFRCGIFDLAVSITSIP